MTVQPFSIQVPQAVLDDLNERLATTRWTAGDTAYMKDFVDYWLNQYDWRKHEAALNQFAHFRTEIDGVGIHFIHEKGKGPNPKPLLLTHGWPDSFYRFHKIIPMLNDPAKFGGDPNDSFDVIVPSIPGFGFSDHNPMPQGAIADLWVKLMERLGYGKFVAGGGDVGSIVTMYMAFTHPDKVTAIHLSDVGYPTGQEDFSVMSPPELEFAGWIQNWWMQHGAFSLMQATKPQTMAFGLTDSPVGWAAWSMNLLSDPTGEIFPIDELLTNIMIYWVTETIGSSMRGYYEGAHSTPPMKFGDRVPVPTAVLHSAKDAPLPREWAERNVNLQRYAEIPAGHFAAWEEPELFANDLREFFRNYR